MPEVNRMINEKGVYRSGIALPGEAETIGSMLERNAARFSERAIIREKKNGGYRAVTWEDFLCDVVSLGLFFRSKDIGRGDRVAVISRNREEMLVTEFALMCIGAIHMPIFAGYFSEQVHMLLESSGAKAVVLSDREQLEKIYAPADLQFILSFDPIARATIDDVLTRFKGQYIHWRAALRQNGVTGPGDPRVGHFMKRAGRIDPGSPCLMMYTSGTSGRQKGVLLTHDNILSQQRALSALWELDERDRFLSYLPWHHSFGGIFEKYTALYRGATLALDESYGKDFDLLLSNWRAIRPSVYFSVPMIYQELVDFVRTHPESEDEIFHGGIKFVFTAAAPLPANISEYFARRGIPVLEGWGLTETAPCCTLTDIGRPRDSPGVVGFPIPGVSIRLDGDGEILIHGPNVMKGYFGNEDGTREVFTDDGWFRTGDIGTISEKGLKLLARKDRIFKLLNAEKVIPTPLENRLVGDNEYIRHAIVVGGARDCLAALIFPDYFLIQERFGEDLERSDEVVKASFRDSVLRLNEENPVKYEHIKAFAVVTKPLSLEDHDLTPSMKVRVENVLKNTEEYIEAIYDPSIDCDCRFLRRVFRMEGDDRPCFKDKDRTLGQCHRCGVFVFED